MSNSRRSNRLKYGDSPARLGFPSDPAIDRVVATTASAYAPGGAYSRSKQFSMGLYHETTDGSRPAPVERRSGIPDGPKTLHETLEDEYERKWSQGYDD